MWDKKTFKIGAFEDISMASPFCIEKKTWEPSMYTPPSLQNHATSMDWCDLINPCIKLEVFPGEMGSRTINWRSWDKIGIGKPPAESIAAVDPAAVETLRPLDREFTKGEHNSPSLLILKATIQEFKQLIKTNACKLNKQVKYMADQQTTEELLLEWELRKCCRTWMCNQDIVKGISWKHLRVYIYGYPCQFGRDTSTLEDVVEYLRRKESKFSKDMNCALSLFLLLKTP